MKNLVRVALAVVCALAGVSTARAACPATPVISAPANGSAVAFGAVSLQWSSAAGAAGYEIFLGVDGDTPGSIANTTNTSRTVVIEPGRSVEWYVVARAAACPAGTPSTPATFTTTCPASGPNAVRPADGARVEPGENVLFEWQPVPGAAGYDLNVFIDGQWEILAENLTTTSHVDSFAEGELQWNVRANFNGSCTPLYSAARNLSVEEGCSATTAKATPTEPDDGAVVESPVRFRWSAATGAESYQVVVSADGGAASVVAETTALEATAPLFGTNIRWWVRSLFPNDCATLSEPSDLILEEPEDACPTNPGRASLISPANGATGLTSPVTFRWAAVTGAESYRVLAIFGTSEPALLGETTATSLVSELPAGGGQWLVQTVFGEDCATTLSERRSFQVSSGVECDDTAPQNASPSAGARVTAETVTFTWSAVPDAKRYHLFVSAGSDEFSAYGETTATSLERQVPRGVIRWFVAAELAGCPATRSVVTSFVAASETECADAQITLIAPAADASASSPVRFEWSGVAGTEAYRVWVAAGDESPVLARRTTLTQATVPLPAGPMRWYVEALRPGCEPVLSDESRFEVAQAADCALRTAPEIIAPAGSETAPVPVGSPVRLQWNASANAFAYRVWIARRGGGVEDANLTQETSHEVSLDAGIYSWFVEALFEGCPALPSARGHFVVTEDEPRCNTDAPTIVAPGAGASVTSPVTFVWTAVEGAEKYRVHAAVAGGEPVVLGVTTETELSRALPPGSFGWRVEAVFGECPSTFSSPATFSVPQAQDCGTEAAVPVAPAEGAAEPDSLIDFVWNAVSGAVKYVLIARVNDGSPSVLATTNETNASVILPPGKVEWWVVTFLSGCPATESAHQRFAVLRAEGCGSARPLLLLPSSVRDAVVSPAHFQWTPVPGATTYRVWVGSEDADDAMVATTERSSATVELTPGAYSWFVEAIFPGCPPTRSARAGFRVNPPEACATPRRPVAQVIGQAISGSAYNVRWTPLANVDLYEVQEATSPDFSDARIVTATEPFLRFRHEVAAGATQYLYRVRGVSSCSDEHGPYSAPVGVFVVAARTQNGSAEVGTAENILQTISLPGGATPVSFTATADKPWVTITPPAGTLPPEGLTLTVTADPAKLLLGTNTATIVVEYATDADGVQGDGTTIATKPLSVSIVTPVMPAGKGSPPPDALIFSVVGHAAGQNDSLFQSDIRLTNLLAQTMKYQVNFTPSGVDGTTTGSSTTVEIAPGATLALDDVVASVFGSGTTSSATGVLEVRSLTEVASTSSLLAPHSGILRELTAAASSRTYNFTPSGTFGQFIPATRFADFVGKALPGAAPTILSLQQVSQSSDYRSNFGFVEASGKAVDLVMRVYDTANKLMGTIPVSLAASEHRQYNGMLGSNGIPQLADGRVEVEVVNGEGKVTAYVSTVDNRTNDPLLVSAVVKGATVADRYVIPGAAFIDNGAAFWVTDVRLFNAGATATPATLTFYPAGNAAGAVSREIVLDAGEIEVIDNAVGGLFGQPNGAGGMITVTMPAPAPVTATARTYNSTSTGTYGQYIPGVTVAESAGANDRALHLLQLEQSSRFRTNIGLAETTGQPAKVEVTLSLPDSIASPVLTFDLAGNDFLQFPLSYFGITDAIYNARVSVKVISGAGRVTAYGSAIDQITQDPTYIPAQ